MRALYWVWRRDLQITLRAPIVYIIGGLFLAVQGIAFAGLVSALSDPRKAAPLGALLEGQLAGTLLTWVLQLVVLTLLGMRTIADDKRGGSWELLLTAQVGEGAAVVGKWLAAVTIYALLWIPTLVYLAVVAHYRVDTGGWDGPSILTGYLGAIAIGAALLAWTVAASAATSTTLLAGAFGFALLIGLFLVGELPASFPDLAVDHPTLSHALSALSLRGQLTTFARGELSAASITFVVGLATAGLSLAITFACAGRRSRGEIRRRLLATLLVAVIAVLAGVLFARHPLRVDVSAARRNSLDSETRTLLANLPTRATLTIVEPTLAALQPIYDEVHRVADRMAEQGAVTVRSFDPASLPGGLDAAARAAGLAPGDLASNGGVVVELGGRRRVVDRLQLVSIASTPEGLPGVETLAIEQALTGALAELANTEPVTVCTTTGHGELPLEHADKDADWSMLADRLRAEGMTVKPLDTPEIPTTCNVVIVAGPSTPLSAADALALQAFVARGGGLLVAAASRPVPDGLAPTGLEGLLSSVGLGLPAAIAVDPTLTVREIPGALLVVDGYTDHEINEGFASARATVWFQPRVVVTSGAAHALVIATGDSWGERDLVHAPPQKNGDDIGGPVVLAAVGGRGGAANGSAANGSAADSATTNGSAANGAAANGAAARGRIVAIGSAESFTTAILKGGVSAGDLWLAHAVRYLAGKQPPKVSVAARSVDQIRLVMTTSQRRTVMLLSIAGIPLAWLFIGALVVLLRRKRDA